MNLIHFQDFEHLQSKGRREEARAALEHFIASFEPADDRTEWVRDFLERGTWRHTIRHELYEQIIFPVLLEGYRRRDPCSTLWLAKTAQNLYRANALWAQIGHKSELQLLREVYEQDPGYAEVRQSLLASLLRWFEYSQHEWPAGILYGADGATPAQIEEILDEVAFARSLDPAGVHEPFIQEYEARTREYQRRLAAPYPNSA